MRNFVKHTMHKGFTLLEVMLAAGLLGIGCLGVLGMLTAAQESNSVSSASTNAVVLGEMFLSAMENEGRSLSTKTPKVPDTTNQPILDKISATCSTSGSTITCTPAEKVEHWKLYGLVDSSGNQVTDGASGKYCVGLYRIKTGNNNLYSGALRILWKKNNHNIAATACTNNTIFSNLDTLTGAKTSEFEFITMPFSIYVE